MKRLGIFALYDDEGEVEPYVVRVLEGIKPYVVHLVAVCNGMINDRGYRVLEKFTDEIIIRDNLGYDAGAYKDTILRFQEKNLLKEYDELILWNDTFFGFFYPLDEFFDRAYRNDTIDFWGFTRHLRGKDKEGNVFEEHIQSYFLFVRQRMFHSEDFLKFWHDLRYPLNYKEAVSNFEVAFSEYFKRKSFRGDAYCRLKEIGIEEKDNENPCLRYPYELLVKARLPVLKIKCVHLGMVEHIKSAFQVIDYLKYYHLYDTDIILQHMYGICGSKDRRPYFDLLKLKEFCAKYKNIYVYGNGKYGQAMKEYLEMQGMKVKRTVVSHRDEISEDSVIEFDELEMNEDTGIVVALNEKNTVQVIDSIMAGAKKEQIFVGKIQSLL